MKRRTGDVSRERPLKDRRVLSDAAKLTSPISSTSTDGAKHRSTARRSQPSMEQRESAFIEHVSFQDMKLRNIP